jgi:hypothetical protein
MNEKSLPGWSPNEKDVVYTPDYIAKFIIDYFKPQGSKLEPCKGKGVFLKYMPDADWCEIQEGRDFFDYNKKVDWIITNPPYSVYDSFLEHCFELGDNIILVVPLNKVMNSYGRIKKYYEYGGIKEILVTTGSKLGFPFGFPCCIIYFKRDYKGNIDFNPFLNDMIPELRL